jgi:hypothetical protein
MTQTTVMLPLKNVLSACEQALAVKQRAYDDAQKSWSDL